MNKSKLIMDMVLTHVWTMNPQKIGDGDQPFTYAKVLEALKFFIDNEVPAENRVLMVTPESLGRALAFPQWNGLDYAAMRDANTEEGSFFGGMHWIVSTQLPFVCTKHKNIACSRDLKHVAFIECTER